MAQNYTIKGGASLRTKTIEEKEFIETEAPKAAAATIS